MAKAMDGEDATAYRPSEADRVGERAAPHRRAEGAPVSPPAGKAAPSTAPESSDQATARTRPPVRRLVIIGITVLAVLGTAYYGFNWLTIGRFMISTDDAYVSADTSTITSKISGYVKSVPAADNVRIKAGEPLVILDDADYRNALASAAAQVATAEATIERLGQQILAANASVNSSRAQLVSAQAAAVNAKASFERVNTLAQNSFASTSQVDSGRATLAQANAAVDAAAASVVSAQANAAVAAASKTEAERTLDQYRVALKQAQLNLDHTVIRAPFDGVTGNGAAQPGEYVSPGQRLVALVPLDDVYVDANFKETQLASLTAGQTARITVDAYPGVAIEGTVEGVSPASGSVFSLLPPENATGNFTKIVQRVAVRIRLPREVAEQGLIRPGMSVVASVDTRTGPSHVATLSK